MGETERQDGLVARGIRWDLSDLYGGPRDPRIREHLDEAKERAERFAARHRGRIERGDLEPDELAEALREYERILELGGRPAFYASLLFAADTQSADAQSLEVFAREAWSEIRNRVVFFDLEVQRMPEEPFGRLVTAAALAPFRHYLEIARRLRPHTLSEAEEQVLNRKELTSRGAFAQLYDEIAGGLRFELELDGERRVLTDAETMALLHRPEPEVRRRALATFLETWRRHELVLTSIFDNLLLDHRIEAEMRRFPSTIAPRHLDNDVDAATVDAMMDAVERHYADVQDYFRLKGRLLGIDRMSVSDVYAPVGAEPEAIPFAEAKAIVLDAFADFSPRFAALAGELFDRRWIDAEVRPGKRAGGFCASHAPGHHPYVFVSYAGTTRDVSTIAHELGHAVHSSMAGRQTLLVYDAPLVLAETASVFAEMLLAERWLARSPAPAERARILCEALDEIYGTIFRQNALTRFELAAHQARRSGRLTAAELGRLWLETQRALFGASVELPEIYRYGWIYIPHFVHSPFYCYAYSFGHLVVLALFERYREEGARFVPRYLELLESGGSEPPARLLSRMGFDVSSAAFWDTGFRAIRRLVGELERLVGDVRG